MALFDLDWWNETARVANKNAQAIRDKGMDAFVVFVGAFAAGAYDKVEDSQNAARTWAASSNAHVRIKRIKV